MPISADLLQHNFKDLRDAEKRDFLLKLFTEASEDEILAVILRQTHLNNENLSKIKSYWDGYDSDGKQLTSTYFTHFTADRRQYFRNEILNLNHRDQKGLKAPTELIGRGYNPNESKSNRVGFIYALINQQTENQNKILNTIFNDEKLKANFLETLQIHASVFNTTPLYKDFLNKAINYKPSVSVTAATPQSQSNSSSANNRALDDVKGLFLDPITSDDLDNPIIFPSGYTYSKEVIVSAIDNKSIAIDASGTFKDPTDKKISQTLTSARSNKLASLLATEFNASTIDTQKIHQLLTCDMTGELFKDPVVAADGLTYEKSFIEGFLKKNNNKTPTGVVQAGELYTNLLVRQVLNKDYCLNNILNKPLELSPEKSKYLQDIRGYMTERLNKKEYKGLFSSGPFTKGYSKGEKLIACMALIHVINGKLTLEELKTNKEIMEALNNKELKKITQPIISFLEKLNVKSPEPPQIQQS